MLAISQAYNAFNFLHWTPSDSGPLVTGFGNLTFSDCDFSTAASVNQIIAAIKAKITLDLPIFAFSLDASKVFFSTTPAPKDVDPVDILSWQINQSQDERFQEVMNSFHYPLASDLEMFLNIHIPKVIKKSIIESTRQYKGEVRFVSIGIFSAENCARYCFKAGDLKSYMIWRMGKYNIDQFLIIEDNALQAYFSVKRSPDTVKLLETWGNRDLAGEVAGEIEKYLKGDLTGFRSTERVFVYQADHKYLDIRKVIEAALDNVTLLNPLKVLRSESPGKINFYKTSYLAETGLIFRGLDV
ncbi:MAG: hypothetical protein GXO91_08915 [FCB group bacterium]|nr:hypothetical protein [FCB group bacterium]